MRQVRGVGAAGDVDCERRGVSNVPFVLELPVAGVVESLNAEVRSRDSTNTSGIPVL
jgi:hypothetical protein